MLCMTADWRKLGDARLPEFKMPELPDNIAGMRMPDMPNMQTFTDFGDNLQGMVKMPEFKMPSVVVPDVTPEDCKQQ